MPNDSQQITSMNMFYLLGISIMILFMVLFLCWFMGSWTEHMPTNEQIALASLNGTTWYKNNADPATLVYLNNTDEGNGAVSFNFQVKDRNGTTHNLRVLKVPDPMIGSRWSEFVDEKQVG